MKYQIIKLYTEVLNISSFQNLINDDKLKIISNFNTSLIPSGSEDIVLFRMEYTLRTIKNPISLNWVGIAVIKFIDMSEEIFKEEPYDLFLENEEIREFIQESIEKFSYFVGGKLPELDIPGR